MPTKTQTHTRTHSHATYALVCYNIHGNAPDERHVEAPREQLRRLEEAERRRRVDERELLLQLLDLLV